MTAFKEHQPEGRLNALRLEGKGRDPLPLPYRACPAREGPLISTVQRQ